MATQTATDKQVNYLDVLSKQLVTLTVQAKAEDVEGYEEFENAAQDVVEALAAYSERGDLTKSNASTAIDYLVATNRQVQEKINEVRSRRAKNVGKTTPPAGSTSLVKYDMNDRSAAGMYVLKDGAQVRVYYGQQSGFMLAKNVKVKDGQYDYRYIGRAEKIGPMIERKMTLAEAKILGNATGSCCACGRKLDDPESVDAGIGPVCKDKF